MMTLLLIIIYIAFISLGLPDSLLGSVWPIMQPSLDVPLSYAGIISMIISAGTILSSLFSDRLTKRFGAGMVTAVSVFLTAFALFGFSVSTEFWMLCAFAVPYGLGAGGVDSALNNFVALHYSPRHMSWLHCFWGVGTSIGPLIMSYFLLGGKTWNNGYRAISLIQIVLTALLFISLPLWKKAGGENGETAQGKPMPLREILRLKGVKLVLSAFFGYCALETTAGLWATSFLVGARGISAENAASYAALFYIGITIGRFLSGIIANRVGDRNMIRLGLVVTGLGVVIIALPLNFEIVPLIGLLSVGLGCAPIYPSIIHATPDNFGAENSQAVIGLQMAAAYCGNLFMPPLFGIIAQKISVGLYPYYMLVFLVVMILTTEVLNRKKM